MIEFAVGLVALAHIALLLGVAHLLYRELLLAVGFVLGGFGGVELFRVARVSFGNLRPSVEDAPLLLSVAFLATFLPYALSPFLAHDDNVYHLLLPRTYLEQHAIVSLPVNLYANMPHLIEVLYTWPLAVWELTAPKVAAFSLHFWILAGLVAGVAPHSGRIGAGLAALLYVSGKNIHWHTETAHVEPALGFFLLVGALASLAWFETKHPGYLTVVGVMCGAACASKYTGWLFASAILLPLLVSAVRVAPERARVLSSVLSLVAIPAGMVSPWLIKNVIVTGNPIYPNLYHLFGGRFWSDIQQYHYLNLRAPLPSDLLGYLKFFASIPLELTLQDDSAFSISLMVLFLTAVLLPRSWRKPALPLLALAGVALLQWAFKVRWGRYLVAWVPVMALAASLGIAPFLLRRRAAPLSLAVLVIGAGIWQLRAQHPAYSPPTAMLTAKRTLFVSSNLNYEVCQFLNQVVPRDSKVLALWDNRFFFLERDFYADSAYDAPTVLAWLRGSTNIMSFISELRAHGVSHVIINELVMDEFLNSSPVIDRIDKVHYPSTQLAADRSLLAQFVAALEEVGHKGDFAIYRLGGGHARSGTPSR